MADTFNGFSFSCTGYTASKNDNLEDVENREKSSNRLLAEDEAHTESSDGDGAATTLHETVEGVLDKRDIARGDVTKYEVDMDLRPTKVLSKSYLDPFELLRTYTLREDGGWGGRVYVDNSYYELSSLSLHY